MAAGVFSTERNDGRLPEAEARPSQRLQSAMEHMSPPHQDESFYVSIHVLLSEQRQDRFQVRCELHSRQSTTVG